MAIQQRPDLRDAAAVQIGHRLKAADAPLKEKVHQHGLHSVVKVVAQSDLGDAQLPQRRVEAPPPQLGAQGAGILLLPLLKHDLIHRHLDAGVGYLQLPTQLRHGVKAHAGSACLQSDGVDSKRHRKKLPQAGKSHQGQQAVLSAGHAHRHSLPGRNHVIILHASAHQAQYLLHKVIPPKKQNTM